MFLHFPVQAGPSQLALEVSSGVNLSRPLSSTIPHATLQARREPRSVNYERRPPNMSSSVPERCTDAAGYATRFGVVQVKSQELAGRQRIECIKGDTGSSKGMKRQSCCLRSAYLKRKLVKGAVDLRNAPSIGIKPNTGSSSSNLNALKCLC